jgi:glycosyltransferase involved in cell wall biosynthesis
VEPAPGILYVVDGRRGHATQQARGLAYRGLFEREGWRVGFVDVAETDEAAVVAAARGHSIVCLLKVASYSLVKKLRGETSVPVVFDLTDALWKPVHRRGGWRDLERILRAVDAVLCENEYLEAYAQRFHSRIFRVPASSQVERFDALRGAAALRSGDEVVIGWVGSPGTFAALAGIRRPLARISARHPGMRLRVVGGDAAAAEPVLKGVPHTLRADYDAEGMMREILAMDIGVFPAPFDLEDYRARGPLKALLYMAAGIPVVCQAGGECSGIFREGEAGLLCRSEEDWEKNLEALVVSAALRRRMGEAGLEKARRDHSLEASFQKLRDALLLTLRATRVPGEVRRPTPRGVRFLDACRSLRIQAAVLAFRLRRRLA